MRSIYRYNLIPFIAIITALLLCIPLMGFEQQSAKPRSAPASTASAVPDETADALRAAGLVDLRTSGADFEYDIRYATPKNLTGAPVYKSPRAYLRPKTAEKLLAANRELNAMGYRILIYDAYRPYRVQRILYEKTTPEGRARHYIADPNTGSNHNRGAAVDISLVRLDGSPVEMPTDFDTFTYAASIYDMNLPEEVIKNRELLASVMVKHGFSRCSIEWWHFDDTEAYKYSLIDVPY